MALQRITIYQNDLLPRITASVTTKCGDKVDLTAPGILAVRFFMGVDRTDLTVNGAAMTVLVPAEPEDIPNVAAYDWVVGDTAEAGIFQCEVVITYTGPKPQTVGRFEVEIVESLH